MNRVRSPNDCAIIVIAVLGCLVLLVMSSCSDRAAEGPRITHHEIRSTSHSVDGRETVSGQLRMTTDQGSANSDFTVDENNRYQSQTTFDDGTTATVKSSDSPDHYKVRVTTPSGEQRDREYQGGWQQ